MKHREIKKESPKWQSDRMALCSVCVLCQDVLQSATMHAHIARDLGTSTWFDGVCFRGGDGCIQGSVTHNKYYVFNWANLALVIFST